MSSIQERGKISQKSIQVSIQPLTIVVPIEKEDVYNRIKNAFKLAEEIANNTELGWKYRLEAIRLIGFLGRVLEGSLKDARLEEIYEQLLELEEAVGKVKDEAKRRRGAPVYASE